MSTKNKPSDWREARRLQALELQAKGCKQNKIAEALGVSAGAVCQWLKKAAQFGAEALRHTHHPANQPASPMSQKPNWSNTSWLALFLMDLRVSFGQASGWLGCSNSSSG